MRILLIQPDSNKTCIGFKRLAKPEPLGLEMVAASAADHDVRIHDMRVDPDLVTALEDFNPDLVGTTGFTAEVPHAQEICRQVRSTLPDARMVVGGHHVSMSPSEFDRSSVDYLVLGEGETTFSDLLRTLERREHPSTIPGIGFREGGRLKFTPPRSFIPKLDDLPMPRRDLVDRYRSSYFFRFWDNVYSIESTRGCPYRCNFCSVWRFFGGKVRFKSPERIVSEVEALPPDCEYFCIVDDNFLASMPRARRVVQIMEEKGIKKKFWIQGRADAMVKDPGGVAMLAKAGLSTVLIGLEAYREEELGLFNKGKDASIAVNEKAIEIMHDNGIDIWGCFLIDPNWDERDFDGLIEYVKRKRIQFLQFTILTPLPGTQLYEDTKHLIRAGWEKFDFFHSVLPTKLPPDRFYEQMAKLYRETVMSFSQMKQMIRQGRIPRRGLQRAKDMLSQVTDPTVYLESFHNDLRERIYARLVAAQAGLERLQSDIGSVQIELGARIQLQLEEIRCQLEGARDELSALQAGISVRWDGQLKGLQTQVESMQQELGSRLRSPFEGLQTEGREMLRLRAESLRAELNGLQTEMAARIQQRLDSIRVKHSNGYIAP